MGNSQIHKIKTHAHTDLSVKGLLSQSIELLPK